MIPAASPGPAPVLVGFHGYAENAEAQLERLKSIPGSSRWVIVSIQALHRFYQRKANLVVASWMTRQDREQAIADNAAYVAACLDAVRAECSTQASVVFAGFSQGVAMAFRAAVQWQGGPAAVIAAGGDVPPEITADQLKTLSGVLMARGKSDDLYPRAQFANDTQRLLNCNVKVSALEMNGGHEWAAELLEPASEFLEAHFSGAGFSPGE